jgi:hypothetical protein
MMEFDMSSTDSRLSIATATPTIAALLGIAPPSTCQAQALARIVDAANAAFDGRRDTIEDTHVHHFYRLTPAGQGTTPA